MTQLIYTYSIVKTLYEQGKDYIDSFWPFILKVLINSEKQLNLDSIQEKVKDDFGLDIPLHTLKIIITRAKRKGFLNQEKNIFTLTKEGEKYLDTLELEHEVERRINELMDDLKTYMFEQYQMSLTEDETKSVFLSFVYKNIEPLVEFFNPNSRPTELIDKNQFDSKYDNVIVEYLEISKQRKPSLYKTLTDIIYGSIISTTANNRNIAEINKNFGKTRIFFDSNYLFSTLGLHAPSYIKPATELLNILKACGFELRVFDFTIEEMVRVLKNYSHEQHIYIPGVSVRSIHSNLKTLGFSMIDVNEYISNIENKIWELGIKIEATNINLDEFKPKNENFRAQISIYKPNPSLRSQNHDLAAIEKIEKIRGTIKRRLEKAGTFFISSDIGLSKFNYIALKHKDNATVCEVITDRLITNILWLKNPSIEENIPLNTIIAIHSRGMFIERKIWIRFCEIIKSLKEKDKIADKDISMLFFNHHIEDELRTYDESEIDKIKPDLVFKELQTVNKLINEKTKQKFREHDKIFKEKLSQLELDKNRKFEEKLSKIKAKLRTRAIKRAKKNALIKMCIPAIGFVIALFYFIFIKNWSCVLILTIIGALSGILSLFDIKISLRNIFKKLRDISFQNIYKKNLSELELKDDVGE